MIYTKSLADYCELGFNQVDGWCSNEVFKTIDLLNNLEINKTGGCLEIGVHHGKLYILLNSVIDSKFSSYAVDIFNNQDLNIDGSGNGSLEIFKKNLMLFGIHKGANTVIIAGDSTDDGLMLRKRIGVGSMRFISIDGGHTAEHTINDLKISSELISNEGVVILDDILNHHWLGVIEGVVKFLDSKPTLIPFAIGHNKLYLSKLSFNHRYQSLFENSKLATKVVNFFGHQLVAL